MNTTRFDLSAQEYGELAVVDRSENRNGKSAWRCLCTCGTVKVVRSDLLRAGYVRSCGDRKAHPARRDQPTYNSAHRRVRELKGPAWSHECEDCYATAEDWAYDGQDPNERTTPGGSRFSVDPAHYRPLCRPCHRAADTPAARQSVAA